MKRAFLSGVVCVLLAALSAVAQAQSEAGTIAAVQGTFEVRHGGAWQTATVGLAVSVGDRLRTGADGRGKVVFQDDSVLDLAPNTEFELDSQTFDPGAKRYQSILRLVKGKVRAWVSEYYREPHARYEVETPTAVAGVRGTEFIATYNSAAEVTEIVGIADQVEVSGKLAVIGAAVQVGPQFYTRVQKGRFPSAPQRLDDARFRQYLEGLQLIGTGRRDGLNVLHPAVAGRLLAPQDMPASLRAGAAPVPSGALGAGPPSALGAQRLSPEVYTNTQPLLDFQRTPPGQAPAGSVRVGF